MPALLLLMAAVAGQQPVFDEPPWQAAWVWGAEHMNRGDGYFRMAFTVRQGLRRAILQTTGDDSFELYVNGKLALRGGFRHGHVYTIDVTEHLRPGRNVIAVVCHNAAYPGGWLAELALIYPDVIEVVASGPQVKFSPRRESGWNLPDFDDAHWQNARIIARPPKGVWGDLPHQAYGESWPLEVVAFSCPEAANAGDVIRARLSVRCRYPSDEPLGVVAELWQGRLLVGEAYVAPKPPTTNWRPRQAYTITIPVRTCAFAPAGECELRVKIARALLGEEKWIRRHILLGQPRKPKPAEARIDTWQASPTIWLKIRGRWAPEPPFIFAGARPVRRFWLPAAQAGFRLVQPLINLPFSWWIRPPDGKVDWSRVDETILKILLWCPDAYLLLRVGVTPPEAWIDRNSSEAIRFADGVGWTGDVYGGTKHQSFASQKWLQQAADGLRALVRHINSMPYAERIIGYHIASGIYGEWHLWSPRHIPDVSEPMRQRFIAFCKRRYGSLDALRRAWGPDAASIKTWDDIRCPDIPQRCAADLGIFKDLSRSRYVTDYWLSLHETTADAIAALARAVKGASAGRAIVGCFYGYITDIGWAQEGGHLAVSKLLRCPYVDYLSSPHSYARREPGMDAAFRAYPRSVRLHGKLFIDENDDRTFLADASGGLRHVSNADQTIQLMRRGLANAIANRCGQWLFDLSGGWFCDDRLIAEMRLELSAFRRALQDWLQDPPPIAAVCSPRTFTALADWKSGRDRLSPLLFQREFTNLFRAGRGADVLIDEDLFHPDLPRYRVYVLLNCWFMPSADRRRAGRLLRNAVAISLYAPGFSDEAGLSASHIAELTGLRVQVQPSGGTLRCRITQVGERRLGIKAGTIIGHDIEIAPRFVVIPRPGDEVLAEYIDGGAAIVAARIAGRIRHIYSAAACLPPELLRYALRLAGESPFIDSPDVVYEGLPFLGIHASSDGPKRLRLPARAIDLLTGAAIPLARPLQMKRGWTLLLSVRP